MFVSHTNHETIVKEAIIVKLETTNLITQNNTSHNSSAGATQATAERNGVLDVDVCLWGKVALIVTSQNVESNSGDEVHLRIEADVGRPLTLTLVGDSAVERVLGPTLGPINGDVQLKIDREGEADNIKAGADVGARAGGLDDE